MQSYDNPGSRSRMRYNTGLLNTARKPKAKGKPKRTAPHARANLGAYCHAAKKK